MNNLIPISLSELPEINDTTGFWIFGSKQGDTPEQIDSGKYLLNNLMLLIPKTFFQYQEDDIIIFIVQYEADLPTSGALIPPMEGDTALYMSADKKTVYRTTYTGDAWGEGIDTEAEAGYIWTEQMSDKGYYFIPGQEWNQLDAKAASDITNDSTVTGTTVKDALQTLYNKSDDFRKWKEDNNYLIAGKGVTGTPANAVILVNNPPSGFNQPNVVYIGNGGGKTNNSVIIKTDIGTYPDSFYTTPTKCVAIGGNFGDGKVNQDINIGYDNNGSWGGGSIVTKTIRIGRNIPIAGQGNDNVAIGDNIDFQYNSNRNCVLGTGSAVRGLYDINNAVILGYDSTHTGSNTVSVGSASLKRRICNVADGVNDNDAVTLKQMNAVIAAAIGTMAQVYSFSIDPNGGTLSGGSYPGSYIPNTMLTLPTSGTKDGYTLDHFIVTYGLTTVEYGIGDTFIMPSGNVTVTAAWV